MRVLPAARRENGIELGPLSARDFTSARDSQIESLASRLTDKIAAHIHERMSEKPKFESPQVHQEVGANRPGFHEGGRTHLPADLHRHLRQGRLN